MTPRPTFAQWENDFTANDTCPWPGPRPLRIDEEQQLVGRAQDCVDFTTAVTHHRLVVLHGVSGIGKSSLLSAGLVPALTQDGFLIGSCDVWNAAGDDPGAFLAENIRASLSANATLDPERRWSDVVSFLSSVAVDDEVSGRAFFETLEMTAGAKAVIVLDQFEELLRGDNPEFKHALFETLSHLVNEIGIRVVISLRSEYLYALRDLVERVSPLTQRQYPLRPIEERFAIELIAQPLHNLADASQPLAEIDAFATYVGQRWAAAQRSSDDRVGLLHLQAMLYAFWEHAAGALDLFTVAAFRTYLDERLEPGLGQVMDDGGITPFEIALTAAAEIKLNHCRASVKAFDSEIGRATFGTLLEIFQHLSSDGYKVPRRMDDLAKLTMDDELTALHRGLNGPRDDRSSADDPPISMDAFTLLIAGIAKVLSSPTEITGIDLLTSPGREVLDAVHRELPHMDILKRSHLAAEPWDADPRDQTAGAMMGLAPIRVLVEILRRFTFAVKWLEVSDIVRVSTAADDDTIVTLIHDRYAEALERIAGRATRSPLPEATGIVRVTAMDLVGPRGEPRQIGDASATTLIINQRWPAGWISATFTNVMFVNCDLRGTGFGDCTFNGVTFVNCLLDGAAFIGCDVRGPRQPITHRWSDDPSDFFVPGAADAQLHASYRELPEGSYEGFFSDEAGLPAIPHASAGTPVGDAGVNLWEITPPTGSLTFYGGRLSTLALRFMTCVDDAWISFRHCGGSGLDIVGQEFPLNLEIYGSAIRHIAVTSCPLDPEGGQMQIEVSGSKIFQAWIGDDIPGTMTVTDSTLVQIFNGSPFFDAALTGATSKYLGLIGVNLRDLGEGLPTPIANGDLPMGADIADPGPKPLIRGEKDVDFRQSDSLGRRIHPHQGVGVTPRWGVGHHHHEGHLHDHDESRAP